jgi:hypothetical protein
MGSQVLPPDSLGDFDSTIAQPQLSGLWAERRSYALTDGFPGTFLASRDNGEGGCLGKLRLEAEVFVFEFQEPDAQGHIVNRRRCSRDR